MAAAGSYRTLPLGVAILSVLVGILGFFLLLASVLLLVASGFAYFHDVAFFGVTALGGAILLLCSVVLLVVAVGLGRLEIWALALAVIVVLVLLVERLVAGPILSLSTLVLALILVYLVAVRRHFS